MYNAKISDLIRQQLTHGSVWVDKDAVHPQDGLSQALRASGAERPEFVAALFAMLSDDSLPVRTGVVAVLREIVSDIGAGNVARVLNAQRTLFEGVAPAWRIQHLDLEQVAAIAVASGLKAGDHYGIQYLREISRERDWGFFVLDALARVDGQWLVDHAKGLVSHDHLGVLEALSPDLQLRLIDILSPYPPELSDFYTQAFWKRLPPDLAQQLRARMWPEG